MNLSLLSVLGISRKEVLVSDLGLNGFVTDLRVGRPSGLPPCLLFELMDQLANSNSVACSISPSAHGARRNRPCGLHTVAGRKPGITATWDR